MSQDIVERMENVIRTTRQQCLHDSVAAAQTPSRILNSWKEIASYLGRGVRTAQRYEEKLGLPIHRPAAKTRSAVVAFADELEGWLRNTPSRYSSPSTPVSGNASVTNVEQIHFKKRDVRRKLARAKQEMDRAHAEYKRNLERYNALKRQLEMGDAVSQNGYFALQNQDTRRQQFGNELPRCPRVNRTSPTANRILQGRVARWHGAGNGGVVIRGGVMEKRIIEQLRTELQARRSEILRNVREFVEESRAVQPDYPQDVADRAFVHYSRELLLQLGMDQRGRLRAIDRALRRMEEEGTFGQCLSCGEEIGLKRLQAVPWAELCVTCQEKQERGDVALKPGAA